MMGMTIGKLHKELEELIKAGHRRKPVCVDKQSFYHPLESDGATILDIKEVSMQWVATLDDDGEFAMNKDGTERGKTVLVISGGWKEEQ
jgi:hypothetical protein